MSTGFIEDPDELDRLSQDPNAGVVVPGFEGSDYGPPAPEAELSPVAPNPEAAFDSAYMPSPEYGPPTPADLAVPPTPTGATGPNETWPPPVPSEAPGAVPPGTAQATLAAAPKTTAGAEDDILAQEQASKDHLDELRRAKIDQLAGQQDVAHQEAEYRKRVVDEETARAKEDADRQKLAAAADASAQADVRASADAIAGFKFKSLWENQTTAQRVGNVLSSALLAIGAGMMKTPKYAMEILDKERAEDHQHQLDNLHQLSDDYVRKHTGMLDARAGRAKMTADLDIARARKDKLLADTFLAAAARAKDENSANDARAYAAQLQVDEDSATQKAHQTYLALAHQRQIDEMNAKLNQARIDELAAKTEMERAHAAGTGGFVPKKGKGAGGGGGGGGMGGAAVTNAAAEFQNKMRLGKDGKALTPAEEIQALQEVNKQFGTHIPLEGKTGTVTMKTLKASAAFDANEARKAAAQGTRDTRTGLMIETKIRTAADDWAKSHGITKILGTQRELSALQNNLKTAGDNPTMQAAAIEKAVSAARGGAASKQALELALHHLGGSLDNAEGVIEHIRSGGLGGKQLQNFKDFINAQEGTAQKEGKEAYDAYEQFKAAQPAEKHAQFDAERARLFSGMHGFGGGGSDPVGTRKPDPNGVMREKGADGKWHRIQ